MRLGPAILRVGDLTTKWIVSGLPTIRLVRPLRIRLRVSRVIRPYCACDYSQAALDIQEKNGKELLI